MGFVLRDDRRVNAAAPVAWWLVSGTHLPERHDAVVPRVAAVLGNGHEAMGSDQTRRRRQPRVVVREQAGRDADDVALLVHGLVRGAVDGLRCADQLPRVGVPQLQGDAADVEVPADVDELKAFVGAVGEPAAVHPAHVVDGEVGLEDVDALLARGVALRDVVLSVCEVRLPEEPKEVADAEIAAANAANDAAAASFGVLEEEPHLEAERVDLRRLQLVSVKQHHPVLAAPEAPAVGLEGARGVVLGHEVALAAKGDHGAPVDRLRLGVDDAARAAGALDEAAVSGPGLRLAAAREGRAARASAAPSSSRVDEVEEVDDAVGGVDHLEQAPPSEHTIVRASATTSAGRGKGEGGGGGARSLRSLDRMCGA